MITNTALITGGAGFIGVNLAEKLLKNGWKVTILDNFSRRGIKTNLKFIKDNFPKSRVKIVRADVRGSVIKKYVKADAVFHLAAQTAVTTSVTDPKEDFSVNAFGTFNVLEAIRKYNKKAVFIYASTNKVYGSLSYLKKFPEKGIDENTPLDFHSPYGVSKGAADSYTKDYARIYGLSTLTLRQSCVYGEHQLGVEDQGWVAHMAARALIGGKINVFGTGTQIRDLLYVGDLTDLYLKAFIKINKVKGEVLNIGGGRENALSVNGYLDFLRQATGKELKVTRSDSRPGDQQFFVSDNSKAAKLLGWKPRTGFNEGLPKMIEWISKELKLFKSF